MAEKKKNKGQFVKGNPGGPGRKPVAQERRYLETLNTVCTEARWEAIVDKAVEQAVGGDKYARDWLSKYLLPAATLEGEVGESPLVLVLRKKLGLE